MSLTAHPTLSAERYELALEAAGLGIIDNNLEEGRMYCSPYCYELYGLHRDEPVTLERLLHRLHPDDAAKTRAKLKAVLDAQIRTPYENEYRVCDAAGNTVRWLRARGRAYFTGDGRPQRLIVTVQDCTNEVHGRSTRQKLLTLVENSVELLSVLELDGRNSYLNKAGMEMLGFDSLEQVLQTPIAELHAPEDIAFVRANVLPSVLETGRWSGPMRVRHLKSGELFWVYNNTIRIDDAHSGLPLAIGAVMRDLRPEQEAQRALEESKRDLELRVEERTAELLRKNRELEEYTYVTSHDLQEPLRKIRLFTDLIREAEWEKMSPLSQERFNKVTSAVDRMSKALRDLLEFSGLSHEELMEEVNLHEIIGQALNDLELLIAEKGATVELGNLPRVRLVPHQAGQLFYNLLGNALKFAHPERPPHIRISFDKQTPAPEGNGTLLWLCVEDNGIGFDPANAEKIFGLFQRLHARHEYPGSGIGLALCRKVMLNHGGHIFADSEPGAGARFYLGFPQP